MHKGKAEAILDMGVWGTLKRYEEAWQNTKDRAMKPSTSERPEQVENVGVRLVQAIFFSKVNLT